jgi:hypothetical protein
MKLMKTKNIILFGLLSIQTLIFSQSGLNCSDAIPIMSSTTSNYSNHTTSGTEFWLTFVATSPTVNISLITTKYGIDAPHIHALNLFSGSSESLTLLADDELPSYNEAKELNINLNTSNLVVGQTYFIRTDRKVTTHHCGKEMCKINASTNPTTFELCIKDVTVVIPPDFSDEKPVSSLALETNRGQLLYTNGTPADEVIMFNERTNPSLYVCKNHVSYVHHGVYAEDTVLQRIDMSFEGANANYDIFKTEQVAGITNYYLPHIPDGVIGNKSYSRVVSNNIYPFIDLQHYSNISGMKNYYVVRPGGNYEDIVMKFDGASTINTNNEKLNVVSELGTIRFEKPHVYYVNPGGQVVNMPFEVQYELVASNKVKFAIPNYPGPQPMTLVIQMDQGHEAGVTRNIDNLVWSTYYGADELDLFSDVDTDASGNVYFTGHTFDLAFPFATQQLTLSSPSASFRMVVGKHLPYGEREWSTIYGGRRDEGYGIATDNLDNVYVVGRHQNSTGNFLNDIQPGAYNMTNTISNGNYASVYRFNQIFGTRTWATLFGEQNSNSDFSFSCIEVDPWNNVYVGGYGVRNGTSPIVASGNQYEQTIPDGAKAGVIVKFNAGVNSLAWSTMFGNHGFLGGGSGAIISEMNITSNGDVYIVGSTNNENLEDFPLVIEQANDYQQNYGGGLQDAFFAKFDSNNELKWSSFLGGAEVDMGFGIDYHEGTSSLYITGQTFSDSSSFPLQAVSNPSAHYNDVINNFGDGFIMVLRDIPLIEDNAPSNGHVLRYSSYYGGSGEDLCKNVEISDLGNAYIIGQTRSGNFPLQSLSSVYFQPQLENNPMGNHHDGFILALNTDLELVWSTYFGGDGINGNASRDDPRGIAVYQDQHLFICGATVCDTLFPITVDLENYPNAFIQYHNSGDSLNSPNGSTDGFLAQFNIAGTTLSVDELVKGKTHNIQLLIYPNPTDGNFLVVGENLANGKVTIQLHNIIGQLVYSKTETISNGKLSHTINLNNVSKGLYTIKINVGDSYTSSKVIIK